MNGFTLYLLKCFIAFTIFSLLATAVNLIIGRMLLEMEWAEIWHLQKVFFALSGLASLILAFEIDIEE